jgi:hypothetical protein
MQESLHDVLPFPYFLYAKYTQLPPLEGVSILRRQFEDATALAGVIAAAVQQEEAEEGDIRHALRLLAEHLHSALALWQEWQEGQEAQEAQNPAGADSGDPAVVPKRGKA